MRPRIWARGDWRLGRRIMTSDSERGWRAALATGLLKEMVEFEGADDEHLVGVTLHAVSALLGPEASFRPTSEAEWDELRLAVRAHLPEAGVTTMTAEQYEAEEKLASLPPVALYFGHSFEEVPSESTTPALIRLPSTGGKGEPFNQVLLRRLGGDPDLYSIAVAYLQGFSFILDEWGRAPSSEEFADFWHFDLPSVKRDEAVFKRAFPEENGPERLIRLLEEGLPRSGALRALLASPVVDAAPPTSEVAPAVGQRWRSPDGEKIMTLIEVEGDRLLGGMYDRPSETSALWTGSRADIADWRLDQPGSVWRVRFDVDVIPMNLLVPLGEAGVIVDRMSRPADPGPGRQGLGVGTVEAHVEAADEQEAKRKIVEALGGHARVELDQVRVRPLPFRIAGG
jgi:hypothetical protein